MSDYSQTLIFADKEQLTTGDPLKTVAGADLDVELNAIKTAIATKADGTGAAQEFASGTWSPWYGQEWTSYPAFDNDGVGMSYRIYADINDPDIGGDVANGIVFISCLGGTAQTGTGTETTWSVINLPEAIRPFNEVQTKCLLTVAGALRGCHVTVTAAGVMTFIVLDESSSYLAVNYLNAMQAGAHAYPNGWNITYALGKGA